MIDIKETFLKLTKNRYPTGHEDDVIKLLPEFNFEKDKHGNYFIMVKRPNGEYSANMFTSHLDTYSNMYDVDYDNSVKHIIEDDFIKTDGTSNLGADDKAGMVIMLNMISENVPGLYYFFMGEEVGSIGSSNLSLEFASLIENKTFPKIKRCISFDRKGYDHVTTHQRFVKCCSDEFARELAGKLNEYGFWYKIDDNGGRTDSYQFTDVVQECTNLSVGYFGEHTVHEKQDLEFLELLSLVVLKIDWNTLPVKRKIDPSVTKTKHKVYGRNYASTYARDYSYNSEYNKYSSKTYNEVAKKQPASTLNDEEFDTWYNEQKNRNWKVDDKTLVT